MKKCSFEVLTFWELGVLNILGPEVLTNLGLGILNILGPEFLNTLGPGVLNLLGPGVLVHDRTWGPHHLSESLGATKLGGGLRPPRPPANYEGAPPLKLPL